MSSPDTLADDVNVPVAGEIVPPGEAGAVRIIVQMIEDRVRATAKTGPARRDAHPKAHGCVRAEFRVLSDLPPALRVGVFAVPRTYQAWIRFSNGSGAAQPDSVGDGRGMAIKLMGVEQSPSTTQDFVMINHPAFFVRNAADYLDLQTASNPVWFFFPSFNPFRFRLHEGMVALAIARQKVHNPLNIRYWSMAPYRLGEGACKFSARPAGVPSPFTATDSRDFLHANLARHLAKTDASFDFMVQLRTRPDAMPIEDPAVTWDETAAPFAPVASIAIPPQDFDSPEQHALCESLSFTPWHCLDAHRPLGGINRVRRVVYERISRLRHELNDAPRREPTDFTL
jgi:catalase